MSIVQKLTSELICRASVTPEDDGCQILIADRLEKRGFKATYLRFDDVDNLWITHGNSSPLFVFAGHTDVVPTGPLEDWNSDPFLADIRDGYLYGRGAADMKGGIAAMVTAAEQFVQKYPEHQGTIAFLITSDEEGPAINGTRKVIEYLNDNNIKIDWCIVGEPSSDKQLADVIRIGRRGSLNGRLKVYRDMLPFQTSQITRSTKPVTSWQRLRLLNGIRGMTLSLRQRFRFPT
jgi:succinyl-diaminopimelate desuccinylase